MQQQQRGPGLAWRGKYPAYIVERAFRRMLSDAQQELEAARRANDPKRLRAAQAYLDERKQALEEF